MKRILSADEVSQAIVNYIVDRNNPFPFDKTKNKLFLVFHIDPSKGKDGVTVEYEVVTITT